MLLIISRFFSRLNLPKKLHDNFSYVGTSGCLFLQIKRNFYAIFRVHNINLLQGKIQYKFKSHGTDKQFEFSNRLI